LTLCVWLRKIGFVKLIDYLLEGKKCMNFKLLGYDFSAEGVSILGFLVPSRGGSTTFCGKKLYWNIFE
jgi:hypothetical protein